MNEKYDSEDTRIADYVVGNLLDFFREPGRAPRFLEAAAIAENLVLRIAHSRTEALNRRYIFFASKLNNNLTPTTIRHFVSECLEHARNHGLIPTGHKKSPAKSMRVFRKAAQKEVTESLALGHSQASAVLRAANVLIAAKRTSDRNERLQAMASTHPLKDSLELLNLNGRALAKEDIKNHLLKLKQATSNHNPGTGVLYGLLKKAEAFSVSRLHSLLGDELFFLCRPLGFLDRFATTLIIEVPTSAHLHALTYRKLEILSALRKDAAFRATKTLRFKVK